MARQDGHRYRGQDLPPCPWRQCDRAATGLWRDVRHGRACAAGKSVAAYPRWSGVAIEVAVTLIDLLLRVGEPRAVCPDAVACARIAEGKGGTRGEKGDHTGR